MSEINYQMDEKFNLKTIHYIPKNKYKCVLIWCHGGCFVNGDEKWNKALCTKLSDHDIYVITSNFRQCDIPYPQATKDLIYLYSTIKCDVPIYFGGSSSGCFFA